MRERRWFRSATAAGVLAASAVTATGCVPDHTFVVTSTVDEPDDTPGDGRCASTTGACTLRAAVQETNALAGEDHIVLAPTTYRLTLPGPDEDLGATGDLDLAGDGWIDLPEGTATIDASAIADRVLDVHAGETHLDGLRIQGGSSVGAGGGIRVGGGRIVAGIDVVGNTARDGGGGIEVAGGDGVDLVGSTVRANIVTDPGGVGGGIHASGPRVALVQSTVSGNQADGGGGIAAAGPAVLHLYATTVTDNVGGGISGAAAANTSATVIGDQRTGADCDGPVASSTASSDSDATCGLNDPSDVPGADPALSLLRDNGGRFPTHVPEEHSPLVDRIAGTDSGCQLLVRDQRRASRPQGNACDIGATERSATFLVVGGRLRIAVTSDDGATWHEPAEPPPLRPVNDDYERFYDVAFDGDDAIAVGGRRVYVSHDFGEHWQVPIVRPAGATALVGVAFAGTRAIAVASDGTAYLSEDRGEHWASAGTLPGGNAQAIESSDQTVVVVGQHRAARSLDGGLTWTAATTPPGAQRMPGLATNGSVFVAVGSSETPTSYRTEVWRSLDDGLTWTPAATPPSAENWGYLNRVGAHGNRFVATDYDNGYTSDDAGDTWQTNPDLFGVGMNNPVASHGDRWVSAGYPWFVSGDDGTTWSPPGYSLLVSDPMAIAG